MTQNRASPLLSLAAEIRNQIWEYALGGKIFRQVVCHYPTEKFLPKMSERKNTLALLLVCRQIYAETALLPFSSNTFSIRPHWRQKAAKKFKTHQCKQVVELRFEMTVSELKDHDSLVLLHPSRYTAMTGLRRIRICAFSDAEWNDTAFSEWEDALRPTVEHQLEAHGFELVVEKMGMSWVQYYADWLIKSR